MPGEPYRDNVRGTRARTAAGSAGASRAASPRTSPNLGERRDSPASQAGGRRVGPKARPASGC